MGLFSCIITSSINFLELSWSPKSISSEETASTASFRASKSVYNFCNVIVYYIFSSRFVSRSSNLISPKQTKNFLLQKRLSKFQYLQQNFQSNSFVFVACSRKILGRDSQKVHLILTFLDTFTGVARKETYGFCTSRPQSMTCNLQEILRDNVLALCSWRVKREILAEKCIFNAFPRNSNCFSSQFTC